MALLYPLYMHYKERIHNKYGPYLAQLRHGAGCRNCQAQWRNSEGTKMDITMGLKAEGLLILLLKPLLVGDFPASHVWWNQRVRGWWNPNILEWWEMTMRSNAVTTVWKPISEIIKAINYRYTWSSDLKRESENPNKKTHLFIILIYHSQSQQNPWKPNGIALYLLSSYHFRYFCGI